MLFAIYATDKSDALETRMAARQAHLDYLKNGFNDKILTAGPRLSDDGEKMIGSLIVIDLPNRAAVDNFCKNDPYAIAGVFATVEITGFKAVFPMKD
ncbi:MAG: YciI family protein [Rhodospirillaceae bacterium]|nr:YciI family protein [Rhodospirillaceae bacterium]